MFGFTGSPANRDHSAALQRMQTGTTNYHKGQVPQEIAQGNAPAIMRSFDGHRFIKTKPDVEAFTKQAFYNPAAFPQTATLRGFVACISCGLERKIDQRDGTINTAQEIAEQHKCEDNARRVELIEKIKTQMLH